MNNLKNLDNEIIKGFKIEINNLVEKNRRLKSYFIYLSVFFIIILIFLFGFFYIFHKKIVTNSKILKEKNEILVLKNKKFEKKQKEIEKENKNLKQIISEINNMTKTYFIYLNGKLVKIDKKKLKQLETNGKIKKIYDNNGYIFIKYSDKLIENIENIENIGNIENSLKNLKKFKNNSKKNLKDNKK